MVQRGTCEFNEPKLFGAVKAETWVELRYSLNCVLGVKVRRAALNSGLIQAYWILCLKADSHWIRLVEAKCLSYYIDEFLAYGSFAWSSWERRFRGGNAGGVSVGSKCHMIVGDRAHKSSSAPLRWPSNLALHTLQIGDQCMDAPVMGQSRGMGGCSRQWLPLVLL